MAARHAAVSPAWRLRARALLAPIPGAELTVIPDAGHFLTGDDPQATAIGTALTRP